MVWMWIILSVVGAQLTLLLHEASHALCVKFIYEGTITAFKPYPNPWRDFGKLGIVRYHLPARVIPRWSYKAPLIKALPLIFLWGVLGILVYGPLLVLAVWETLDAALWLFQYVMPSWYKRMTQNRYWKFDASKWWYTSFGDTAEFDRNKDG